jgi:hypothetical protein
MLRNEKDRYSDVAELNTLPISVSAQSSKGSVERTLAFAESPSSTCLVYQCRRERGRCRPTQVLLIHAALRI